MIQMNQMNEKCKIKIEFAVHLTITHLQFSHIVARYNYSNSTGFNGWKGRQMISGDN